MTPPREILPGKICFVTARTVGRTFRFVPKRRVRKALLFILAVVSQEFRGRIALHEFQFLSNHYHLVLTDITGCLPEFIERMNALIARCTNAIHGSSGTVISGRYNNVGPTDDEKVVDHCVYTLANACSAHLVRRTKQWTNPNSFCMRYGQETLVKMPKVGIWSKVEDKPRSKKKPRRKKKKKGERAGRTKLPRVARLRLERPAILPELGDEELRDEILRRLDERELELIKERRKKGIEVLGMQACAEQEYWMFPTKKEKMFRTTPNVSGRSKWSRIEAIQRRAQFIAEYREALERYLAGEKDVVFPPGTWLMRKRFGVTCRPPP